MFRRFRESPYWKAAVAMTAAGGILIIFHNWIRETKFAVGFETLNRTMAPIYIGVILAFLLCPVYNKIVKTMYFRMLANAHTGKTTVIGTKIIHGPEGSEPVDSEEKRKILSAARAFASIACTLIVVGLISMLVYFFVPQVVESSINLMDTLPERLKVLSEWLNINFSRFPQLTKWVDNIANAGTADIIDWIRKNILQGNAVSIAGMVSSGVITAFKFVANTVVGIIIMVYLLNYKERLFAISRKIIAATCSKKRQESLYEFSEIVNETFIGFIVGRIIDSFIVAVMMFVSMALLNMPFAPMIGVIVGVSNMIPFFGPLVGAIPSFMILMLEDPGTALEFVILVIIVQQVDANIIDPKIVGEAVGIGSFWVLLSVLIGGGLFGFAGMALGVPVFAVIYRYIDKVTIKSLKKHDKKTKTTDYFTLEQFGIDEGEVSLEIPQDKNKGLLKRMRKKKSSSDAVCDTDHTRDIIKDVTEGNKENKPKKDEK